MGNTTHHHEANSKEKVSTKVSQKKHHEKIKSSDTSDHNKIPKNKLNKHNSTEDVLNDSIPHLEGHVKEFVEEYNYFDTLEFSRSPEPSPNMPSPSPKVLNMESNT
eukprot:226130_1